MAYCCLNSQELPPLSCRAQSLCREATSRTEATSGSISEASLEADLLHVAEDGGRNEK
jgi:hypothetical protein